MISDEFYPDFEFKKSNVQDDSVPSASGHCVTVGGHSVGSTNTRHTVSDLLGGPGHSAPPPSPRESCDTASDVEVLDTSALTDMRQCSACGIYISIVTNQKQKIEKITQDVRYVLQKCIFFWHKY